jgi:hypothetical protein
MKKLVLGLVALGMVACSSASTSTDAVEGTNGLKARSAACTPDTQPSVWANSFTQPLKPPRFAAGLDLAVTDDYQTMTLDGANQALCAGKLVPDSDPSSTEDSYAWGEGDNPPLSASFDKTTHKMTAIAFGTGYTGGIDFKSREGGAFGAHTYSAKPGGQILRDGQPLTLDWADQVALDKAGTELFDALVATFAPTLPGETVNCRTSQHCLLTKLDTGEAIFGARDVHFYFHFAPGATPAAAPQANTDYLYMLPVPPGYTPPSH